MVISIVYALLFDQGIFFIFCRIGIFWLRQRIVEGVQQNRYKRGDNVEMMTATSGPCAETITLDRQMFPTAIINVTQTSTSGYDCWWNVESPPNTDIIIEFRVFRLEAYNELFIYDSVERLLLIIDAVDQLDLSLNPVISDSFASLGIPTLSIIIGLLSFNRSAF